MIQLSKPSITDEEVRAVERVLRSGWLVAGPEGRAFEEELAAASGKRYACALSSGTAALHLCLWALPRAGADLLVPALTFVATANVAAFVGSGLRVHLGDVDPDSYCLPEETLRRWLQERRGPAMVVHQFGFPAPTPTEPEAGADQVIADAACAIGVPAALRGACACLSFHPRKILTTGEGGAVLSDDQGLIEEIRSLRAHGLRAAPGQEVMSLDAPGLNYRLPEMAAALGRVQLRRLPELIERHAQVAGRYRERLRGRLPLQADAPGRVWQSLIVLLPEGVERAALRARLKEQGIETQIASYGLHRTRAFAAAPVYPGPGLPEAERLHQRALALPLHTGLRDADVDQVCDALQRLLDAANPKEFGA